MVSPAEIGSLDHQKLPGVGHSTSLPGLSVAQTFGGRNQQSHSPRNFGDSVSEVETEGRSLGGTHAYKIGLTAVGGRDCDRNGHKT